MAREEKMGARKDKKGKVGSGSRKKEVVEILTLLCQNERRRNQFLYSVPHSVGITVSKSARYSNAEKSIFNVYALKWTNKCNLKLIVGKQKAICAVIVSIGSVSKAKQASPKILPAASKEKIAQLNTRCVNKEKEVMLAVWNFML